MASLPSTFKAYAHNKPGSPEALEIIEFPLEHPTGRNLLVKVEAVATNPVDGKVREGHLGQHRLPKILGYDAAGIVKAIGDQVQHFAVGDEIYFAGNIAKQGANAEYTTVDERIVGRKPKTLTWEQTASIPLCALTVWEPLLETAKFIIPAADLNPNAHKSIIIIGGAGGVGSMAIQIAKSILKFGKVIATASRNETVAWCKTLGADHVIGHNNLKEDLEKLGLNRGVDVFYCTIDVNQIWERAIEVTKPCGVFVGITGWDGVNMSLAFGKRIQAIPEFMFARAVFEEEPEKQGVILNAVSQLLDEGLLKHNLHHIFDWHQIKEAQALQDSGKTIGKIGLKGK